MTQNFIKFYLTSNIMKKYLIIHFLTVITFIMLYYNILYNAISKCNEKKMYRYNFIKNFLRKEFEI